MTKITRGEFLGRGGASMLAALGIGGAAGCTDAGAGTTRAGGPKADLIVVNGNIITVDDALPTAEAFAVTDGRFAAIGSNDDIRDLAGEGTEIIDAEGMTITPGFVDAHSHPASGGVTELVEVNLDLRSMAEIKEALARRARDTPPGEWVLAFKYDDTKVREGRRITRQDLDEAVPDHPVRVSHRGGHLSWYNSRAFEVSGVTVDTPDPPGGHIVKTDGQLNGLMEERANSLMRTPGGGSTREQRQAGVKLITELMAAAGITTVHDAGTSVQSAIAYQDALDAGELMTRVNMLARGSLYTNLRAAGIRTGFGSEYLRVGPVKFGADGSASGRTMYMSTPYVGRPDDHGILTMTPEEIHEAVEEAHRSGWQIGVHANGDLTIEYVLDAYERMAELYPRADTRHRIEHCTLVNDDLLRRIAAGGVIPLPFYTYVYYHGDKWAEYGEDKVRWMFAHRSFLDHGIPVGPASDYVPGPFEPMMALQSLVTRVDYAGKAWGTNQCITVDEAIRVCTLNGAIASHEENVKGSITMGKYADFVLLGADPRTADPSTLKDIPIMRTVMGGRTTYLAT